MGDRIGAVTMGLPLEPSAGEVRALTDHVVSYLVDFLGQRRDAPASDFDGVAELLKRVREPIAEEGRPLAEVMDLVAAATAKCHDTTGDGWLAYVPGGGLYTSALGEFIARTTNRFVGVWEPAPVLAQIEATTIRWFCDLFEYPEEARGVLTTGGSLATFSAVVTARHALVPDRLAEATVYVSGETHGAAAKAAVLAGFARANVRFVPTTPRRTMDPVELQAMIENDEQNALKPCLVVATAGTVNTGAVDELGALVDVAHRSGCWLHIDAAYGGFFQLTERGRERLRGIEVADSIALDPHKGMFLPYGTGVLLVREGRHLREAHEVHGAYLQDLAPEGEIPNFADYSAELTREARGLRVWMPIMLHGLRAFREALDEKLDLAQYVYDQLKALPQLEVPWEPELSIVGFRCSEQHWADPDAATLALLERINASRRVFLSSTLVDGRMTIRVCILSVHTHRDRIDELLGLIKQAAQPEQSGPA